MLGSFGDTVIVGGLATLRMPGSLEISKAQLAFVESPFLCLFWEPNNCLPKRLFGLRFDESYESSDGCVGFCTVFCHGLRSKAEQCEAIGISDAPCGRGLLWLRCASRCDAAAGGRL